MYTYAHKIITMQSVAHKLTLWPYQCMDLPMQYILYFAWEDQRKQQCFIFQKESQ